MRRIDWPFWLVGLLSAVIGACVSTELVFAQEKPAALSRELALEADLEVERTRVNQLTVRLQALEAQVRGLNATIDALLQLHAQPVAAAVDERRKPLIEKLVKALGGDPTTQTYDFDTKVLKAKESK
jgi:CRISPR/Cas system-associated protein Cas7 (RAMP superfamily)